MHEEIDKNKIKKALYIVSTPIGNLGDITLRSLDVLKISDYILCEDTRVAQKLLNHFNIKSRLISYHKFNEKKNVNHILKLLSSGNVISLISDSGTPLISDPGKILVENCIKNNIEVVPIPGPSSVIAALSICGFSNNFYFHGFLANKENEIKKDFSSLSNISSTLIFFISAKKFNNVIEHIKNFFPNRKIVICKEITKFYEEFIRTETNNLSKIKLKIKGEITVVISEEKISKKNSNLISESDKIIINKLINKISVKDISEIMSLNNKKSKSIIYNYCIKLKNNV
tara:strand:+ start:432 stop:1289 length:858 start_codon:yes stop_codon:yes gene_type:complete